MAQHDLSDIEARATKLGYTREDLLAVHRDIKPAYGTDSIVAWNRSAESAAWSWILGIEGRAAQAAPASEAPASPRQVDYIVSLLHKRRASGEGGGFVATERFYLDNGRINLAVVEKLTKADASALITSLKGEY